MSSPSPAGPSGLTLTKWLVLIMAAIGFAFDIYELLMLPLILRPALVELLGASHTPELAAWWVGVLFYVPALAGGAFGLLGGYLTDRFGRRRVLTWSILLYAVSAFLAGFSTSVEMLLVLRCTTFVGVCVEFVAAVAWLAELFPEPHQRERALGYTQAFSSIGGLLVAGANGLAVYLTRGADPVLPHLRMPEFLVPVLGEISDNYQHAWRYTLMSGLIPAIPLIVIRPFLPESPIWAQKKAAGTLKRPSILELFAPRFRRTTIVTAIMFACSYGAAFGAIQHIPRIVPGLEAVQEMAAGRAEERLAEKQAELKRPLGKEEAGKVAGAAKAETEQAVAATVTQAQEIGGLLGRFLLALLVVRIVSRRQLLRIFQVPLLFLLPLVFAVVAVTDLGLLYVGIFLVALLVVGQFSFWGNYLPVVYPVHLRGTGESFAANIGGRMVGTSFAAVTSALSVAAVWPETLSAPTRLAYSAALVGTFVVVLGFAMSFLLPEPPKEGVRD